MFGGIGRFRDIGNPFDPRRARSLPTPAAANLSGLPSGSAENILSVLRSSLPDYGENPVPGSRRDRIQRLAEGLQNAYEVPTWERGTAEYRQRPEDSYTIGRSQPSPDPGPEAKVARKSTTRETRLSSGEALNRARNTSDQRNLSAEAVSANPGDDIVVRRGMENLLQGTRNTDRDKGWGRRTPALTTQRRKAAGFTGVAPEKRKQSPEQAALTRFIESRGESERRSPGPVQEFSEIQPELEEYGRQLRENIAFVDTAQDVTRRDRYQKTVDETNPADPSSIGRQVQGTGLSGDWRKRNPSSWTENDNASVGAAPNYRIPVPTQQADGQWKELSGRRKGQQAVTYLDPSEIVETRATGKYQNREIDSDATAPWDKEKQVSLGGLAKELRDEAKTQVIDNVTLNALAAEGRVKRLPQEEIQRRSIDSKGKDSAVATLKRTAVRDGVLLTDGQGQEVLAYIDYDATGAPTGLVKAEGVAFKPRSDMTVTSVGKYTEEEEVLIYAPKGAGQRRTLVDVPDPDDRWGNTIKEERTLYRVGEPMNRNFDVIREKLKPFAEPGMGPFLDHAGIRRNAEKLPAGMRFEELVNALAADPVEEPTVRDAAREILAQAAMTGEMPTRRYGDKPTRGTVASLRSGIDPRTGRNPEGRDSPDVVAGKQLRAALLDHVETTGQAVPQQEAIQWAEVIGRRWGVDTNSVLTAAADPANDPGRELFPRDRENLDPKYLGADPDLAPFFIRERASNTERLVQAAREGQGGRRVDLFPELTDEEAKRLIAETYEAEITGEEPGYQFQHTGGSESDFLTADAITQSGPVEQVTAGQKPYVSKEAEAIRAKYQGPGYKQGVRSLGAEGEAGDIAAAFLADRLRARQRGDDPREVAVRDMASSQPESIKEGVPNTSTVSALNAPASQPVAPGAGIVGMENIPEGVPAAVVRGLQSAQGSPAYRGAMQWMASYGPGVQR